MEGLQSWKRKAIIMGEYRIDCTENQLVVKVDWIAVLTQSLEDEVMEENGEIPAKQNTSAVTEIYDCSKDGCTRSFKAHNVLEQQIFIGNCDYNTEKSSHDLAKVMYGQ